ncbi:helix-turn-helix domain-containing protein [Candidatus Dormiibacter inghamiae]|uniref:TetR/AcrR family transcriptional regulator n=1 Tax=Candidatus Dormiibacter inghamiae TaxID=3127013 RepID=UPI0030C6F877
MKPAVKRRYDATGRQAGAAATRHSILVAAREVFLERGYVAATMPAIAERSGVALDTVYASAGAKPVLFRELIETAISGQDEAVPAELREYVKLIQAEPEAAQKLEIYAAAVTAIQTRLAPLVALVRDAAATDQQLARLWQEIADRRAANMRLLAANIASTGRLQVEIEEAADVIWATNSPEFFLLMVRDRGWEPERFQAWLAATWKRLLLVQQ